MHKVFLKVLNLLQFTDEYWNLRLLELGAFLQLYTEIEISNIGIGSYSIVRYPIICENSMKFSCS